MADGNNGVFICDTCGRSYKYYRSLRAHKKYQCGKAPAFKCPLCDHVSKLKGNLKKHYLKQHSL